MNDSITKEDISGAALLKISDAIERYNLNRHNVVPSVIDTIVRDATAYWFIRSKWVNLKVSKGTVKGEKGLRLMGEIRVHDGIYIYVYGKKSHK